MTTSHQKLMFRWDLGPSLGFSRWHSAYRDSDGRLLTSLYKSEAYSVQEIEQMKADLSEMDFPGIEFQTTDEP